MEYDVQWLIDEYLEHIKYVEETPLFPSNWEIDIQNTKLPVELLDSGYSSYRNKSHNYFFMDEIISEKKAIESAAKRYNIPLASESISICGNGTTAIFLSLKALNDSGIKRFLIITPVYFTTLNNLRELDISLCYYHLREENSYQIDFLELCRVIEEQFIEAIILTDPLFGSNIEMPITSYEEIVNICTAKDIWLMVDYIYGGMTWGDVQDRLFPVSKLNTLLQYNKFLFIENITKRLMTNGVKFANIYGNPSLIKKIDHDSVSLVGSLTSLQVGFLHEIYREDNASVIEKIMHINVETAQNCYNRLKSLLLGTCFRLTQTNCGFFSLVEHKHLKISDVNIREVTLSLLKQKRVMIIPSCRYLYYQDNPFGFRINLTQSAESLFESVLRCIHEDF